MRVIIEKNYDELSRWAARHVVETIKAFQPTAEKPFVLGLPTGSSPMGMYAEIVKAVKAGEIFQARPHLQHGRICRLARVSS